MSQRPDQIIAGKYRLIRRLARGGMGSVYRARHLDLETDVALKFLRPETEVDEQSLARFKREARAAAGLKSPHVVRIFDFGVDEELPYIVMELLEGEDLNKLLERVGSLPVSEATQLIEEAGQGLSVAHAAGVIHRDIKPANIFLSEEGGKRVVKLLDFGIAKETSPSAGETTTGMVFGSPSYMSPEQARGGSVDARGDVWSLGAVYYRMILGKAPFSGENASDIVVKLCTEEASSASSILEGKFPELDELFMRVLAKDPSKRFADLQKFLDACSALSASSTGAEVAPVDLAAPRAALGRLDETAPIEPVDAADEEPSQSSPESEQSTKGGSTAPIAEPSRRWRPLLLSVLVLLGGGFFLLRQSGTSSVKGGQEKAHSPAPVRQQSTALLESEVVAQTEEGSEHPSNPPKEKPPATVKKPPKPSKIDSSPQKTKEKHTNTAVLSSKRAMVGARSPAASSRQGQLSATEAEVESPGGTPREKPATDPLFGLPVNEEP